MLLETFDLDAIERLGLRVGTVHQFQGNERDHVVVSLATTDHDAAGSRRFVEDPNLFNVMVTRARRSMNVVASPHGTGGLVGAYLDYAGKGPQPPPPGRTVSGWVEELCGELGRSALRPRPHYPVGRWTVDVVVEAPAGPIALDCTVDAAGPEGHLEKHRQLAAMGWRFLDAYPSRFAGDIARAVLTLTAELRAER